MLIFNPKILVYDLGFQLSFLATLGLVYLNPVLIKVCKIESLKSKVLKIILNDYFLTTMSAIIMTQPLILYQFGKISLIAPIANILVLPFLPLAMMLGFIAGLGAMIWTGLGWIIGWSVWLVLSYVIFILSKLASLSWAYWEIPKIGVWLMVGLYLGIIGLIYWNKYKGRSMKYEV
jgi:competence protein ComEC